MGKSHLLVGFFFCHVFEFITLATFHYKPFHVKGSSPHISPSSKLQAWICIFLFDGVDFFKKINKSWPHIVWPWPKRQHSRGLSPGQNNYTLIPIYVHLNIFSSFKKLERDVVVHKNKLRFTSRFSTSTHFYLWFTPYF